jgi:hypothetical protein
MGFHEAIDKLNEIKRIGLIRDYAIGGAYAVTLYDVPQATYDLDVFVILSLGSNFSDLYDYFLKEGATLNHEHIIIGDLPVQFFPDLGPLYSNAIEDAQNIEFDGISTRFISLEHLILMLLTSFRPKDKIRIAQLLGKANKDKILNLMRRFDDEQRTLSKNYGTILEAKN